MLTTDERRRTDPTPPYRERLRGWRARAWAWTHLLFVDHGLLRLVYLNHHRVGGGLWRSAQPAPHDLARFARRGIKTVLCVRAGDMPGLDLEREACAALGLRLVELKIRGRAAPSREQIRDVIALLRSAEYPALVHCKSGADRTGLIAAIHRLVIEKRPLPEAVAELSLRFGHLRGSPAGILDAFFDAYAVDGAGAGFDFETWLAERYDPARLTAEFRARPWSTWLSDTLLGREY